MTETLNRFWSKVDRSGGPDACWPWLAGMRGKYGQFWFEGKNIGPHVFSFMLANGKKPKGGLVCHSCDNPICCNDTHLFDGTYQSNMTDKVLKGRQVTPKGEQVVTAKLTDSLVIEVRSRASENQRKLALELGVSQTLISLVINRRIWRHV